MRHLTDDGGMSNATILTEDQVIEILKVESRTLRLWRRTRALPFIKISSRVIRYRQCDLDEWLANNRVVLS
jgi:hypothetical protein